MIKKHADAIGYALDGLRYAFSTQSNYKVHILLSGIALAFGWMLQISYFEFLIIIVMIIIGLTLETVNTAIERTTDAIDTAIREDIRIAKDVSAGAMLLYAIGAVIIAAIIFLPKLV